MHSYIPVNFELLQGKEWTPGEFGGHIYCLLRVYCVQGAIC